MATVVSLTEARIRELMAGWVDFELTQDEINAIVVQLRTQVEAQSYNHIELQEVVLPQFRDDLNAANVRVSELNSEIPNIQLELEQARAEVQDILEITVPAIRTDLDATIQNAIDRPKVYVQPEAPLNPDDEERYLVVGDSWFDSDDNNRQRVWNGVEWSTFGIDVPDFSLTVKKFLSSTHHIY